MNYFSKLFVIRELLIITTIFSKEYSFHDSQLDLIDSTLNSANSEKERRAKNYLKKFRGEK